MAILVGVDGVARCAWAGHDPLYQAYHDREWGYPDKSDRLLFEKICLEGFQSGLSWLTILRKRENFRRAFDRFDFHKVAKYGERDVARLLGDAGIVRHRGKIESAINNARRAVDLEREFGTLDAYFRTFRSAKELAKDLKRRGWSFVGETTIYAFMQASGMVNDHAPGCFAALAVLLASARPKLNRGRYVFAQGAAPDAVATFREEEGVTSVVTEKSARKLKLRWSYPCAWITLTVYSDLNAIGFLAEITKRLAAAGISCNVFSAFHHDHLFVPYDERQRAMKVLRELRRR